MWYIQFTSNRIWMTVDTSVISKVGIFWGLDQNGFNLQRMPEWALTQSLINIDSKFFQINSMVYSPFFSPVV